MTPAPMKDLLDAIVEDVKNSIRNHIRKSLVMDNELTLHEKDRALSAICQAIDTIDRSSIDYMLVDSGFHFQLISPEVINAQLKDGGWPGRIDSTLGPYYAIHKETP